MMYSRRREAVRFADAVNATEGVSVRRYAVELSELWASGKLNSEQMRAALEISHRQLAIQVRKQNG